MFILFSKLSYIFLVINDVHFPSYADDKFERWSNFERWILTNGYDTGLFLHLLQKSENQMFSHVFRGYRKREVAWNGSRNLLKQQFWDLL